MQPRTRCGGCCGERGTMPVALGWRRATHVLLGVAAFLFFSCAAASSSTDATILTCPCGIQRCTAQSAMSPSLFARSLDRLTSKARDATNMAAPSDVSASTASAQSPYFSIRVIDAETGRGIPLVFLKTTFKATYITDSAGYVAFLEPGLMTGHQLWMNVASYGYESPTGFLGANGTVVEPMPGRSVEIKLKRSQIAQRLYRMTGYGIYRDSHMLGLPTPIEKPVLNADVAGSDTIQCAKFQGKLLWMWQDTDQMKFILGNFKMTAATTSSPERLDPERGMDFKYYTVDDVPTNFARAMVDIKINKEGNFPIWVDGLTVVQDMSGKERLIARFAASDSAMKPVEEGLVLWNEATEMLERLTTFQNPGSDTPAPGGHAIYVRDNGVRYVYYGRNMRVRADFDSAKDASNYEAFTCLTSNGKQVNRKSDGSLDWRWQKGGKAVHYGNANQLATNGTIPRHESPYQLVDIDTKQHLDAHHASVAWNPYLKLWVNIIQQNCGDTMAGEIWFSTATSPEGPWIAARKVTTHFMHTGDFKSNHNDLYNPVQHSELMQGGGRFIYFSGTFVNMFSGNSWPAPYYNYNNLMYRLDLKDNRLHLPQPPRGLWNTTPDEAT